MRTSYAILLTLGLAAFSAVCTHFLHFNPIFIIWLGSALWAAWDSSRIHFARYKSDYTLPPIQLFGALLVSGLAGLIAYLSVRHGIIAGQTPLKATSPAEA